MEKKRSGLGNEVEGFTPVRRRLTTIHARQPSNDLEKEWTAARCNRLLRALKSRVAILNKELSRAQSGSQGPEHTAEAKAGTTRKAEQDADWTQARKKVKRTYSTRGGRTNNDNRGASDALQTQLASKETRIFIPGEVLVPTPILNRARGGVVPVCSSPVPRLQVHGQVSRPNKRTKSKDTQSNYSQLSVTLSDIRKRTPASRYTIYEGIYNGLEALLKATVPEEPQNKRGGSKSLLSMCLNRVPRYIAEEEELFAAHMEATGSKSALNSRDISTEIYDDLEAFGSNGKGWKHLRTIVRSHGIQVVSDAIRTGSLDAEFVGILITLCIHTRAPKEAQTLLSSLLLAVRFPGPKSVFTRFGDESETRPLSMLWRFVEITGGFSFQYRQLSILFSDGLLPLNWLASKELSTVWTRAIQVLSHGSTDTDALMFLNTVLPLLAQSGDLSREEASSTIARNDVMFDATMQTFSSLLTTLSSIMMLSKDSGKQAQSPNRRGATTRYEHFGTLIRSCLAQWELSHAFNIQGTLLVTTNLIVHTVSHRNPGSAADLVDILLNHLRQTDRSAGILSSYHELVTFICSVARCCGRGSSNSGFEHLEALHQILESLASDRESDGGNILREIIADSALAFSQEIPDRKHLDYAATLEARVHRMETKPRVSLTPGHNLDKSRVGFRWEEGISEWVTATPSMNTTKSRDSARFSGFDQSKCGTPLQPPLRRKVDKATPLHMRACISRASESMRSSNIISQLVVSSPVRNSSTSGLDRDSGDECGSPKDDHLDYDDSEDDLVDENHLEIDSPNGFDASGDELATNSVESPDEDEDSEVELQPSSPQSDSSIDLEQSQTSSSQSEGSLADESFTSATSGETSRDPGSGRRYISRVPRLSRRVLRRSLQWQLFDESDDELSFISLSSEGESILQEVANIGPGIRRLRQKKGAAKQHKSFGVFGDSVLGDSEDELCI